ncbi:MAG: iron chelate uptake ABC transporter family permease subunit, partial [Spirochaetales bacterium]|nr:iron chelate uptake ABC transporter family permease subunit [Spirochaetales bacterium]
MKLAPLFAVLAVVAALSLLLGRYPSPGLLGIQVLRTDELAVRLLLNLRLPRIIAGILLGCSLAAAGTVFQM